MEQSGLLEQNENDDVLRFDFSGAADDISVPDKEQAEIMCNHWKDRSQEIYAYVMKSLMSEHGVEKK